MRLEDNMMPVLTGLVFAVVLGMTVQNSDDLMKAFSKAEHVEAADDVFFVRAGTSATLDVLANDTVKDVMSETDIQIVTGPLCGDVTPGVDGITYTNSTDCEGPVHFTYCIGQGETCDPAEVAMSVRPAPVAVADAFMPKLGGLVPLAVPSVTKSTDISDESSRSDQPAPISAFVVSLAPQTATADLSETKLSRYMINIAVSDLNKTPTKDATQLVNLRSNNVPLSAVRTARFLTSYPERGTASLNTTGLPLVEMGDAEVLGNNIELDDETVRIDLKAPEALSGLDQG